MNEKTINDYIILEDIGIHTGKKSKVKLIPKYTYGISFLFKSCEIPLNIYNIRDTFLSTKIGNSDFMIYTIEHLLSVLNIFNITNLYIEILEGNEIPIFDGCAYYIFNKIKDIGIRVLKNIFYIKYLCDKTSFKFKQSLYHFKKKDNTSINCIFSNQSYNEMMTPTIYLNEISKSKTFCSFDDINKIKLMGYGNGGNQTNTIVYHENKILTNNQTYDNEFVRHKILDFLGDLYILNFPIVGHFDVNNPNHTANVEFVKHLNQYVVKNENFILS